jgi:hypothetical protein
LELEIPIFNKESINHEQQNTKDAATKKLLGKVKNRNLKFQKELETALNKKYSKITVEYPQLYCRHKLD